MGVLTVFLFVGDPYIVSITNDSNMSFVKAATMNGLVGAVTNYSIADDLSLEEHQQANPDTRHFDMDEDFWKDFIQNPSDCWDKRISIGGVFLSDWVARIPGLYWLQGDSQRQAILQSGAAFLESRTGDRKVYNPIIKSRLVLGVSAVLSCRRMIRVRESCL